MGGPSTSQLTLAKALEIAKGNHNGQVPAAVTTMLENSIRGIWGRIQEKPDTYVMTKDEFAVFSYYRGRYENDPLTQPAVTRFWNHFKIESPRSDGAQLPSRSQGSSGAQSSSGPRPSS